MDASVGADRDHSPADKSSGAIFSSPQPLSKSESNKRFETTEQRRDAMGGLQNTLNISSLTKSLLPIGEKVSLPEKVVPSGSSLL